MLRITDQYFWNFVFSVFFIVLVVMGMIILDTEAHLTVTELTTVDFILITLATWLLVRLFVYDTVTKWVREQFWDARRTKSGVELTKPKSGPRRTLADLFSCPWCIGVWMAATVTFFYLLTPLAYYPTLFLAIAALASYLQLLANLTGYAAEHFKTKNERGF
ncbi:hypothetical protein CL655_00265 [bacterium]|nr:hypothetical protein [bacterium]|tara:strand:- start:2889 stop:3374 length:486 start_codon:yes stop_codon:yes gene_type:complete